MHDVGLFQRVEAKYVTLTRFEYRMFTFSLSHSINHIRLDILQKVFFVVTARFLVLVNRFRDPQILKEKIDKSLVEIKELSFFVW